MVVPMGAVYVAVGQFFFQGFAHLGHLQAKAQGLAGPGVVAVQQHFVAFDFHDGKHLLLAFGGVAAQLAAHELAWVRVGEMAAARGGGSAIVDAMQAVLAYAERRTRAAIADMPDGEWTHQEALEGDGVTVRDSVIGGTSAALGTRYSTRVGVSICPSSP